MREIWSTVFTFLLILKPITSTVPTIKEILRTDQYFFVSQQDGVTTVETGTPEGRCPHFMARPKTNHPKSFDYSGFHLVRDHLGRMPPMLMTIREDANDLKVNIFALNATNIFEKQGRKVSSFSDNAKIFPYTIIIPKGGKKLQKSLFDSRNRILYLDFSTPDSFAMEQFYIDRIFTPNFVLIHLHHYGRSSPSSRFDWEEDHYSGKFYYKERIDDEIALYEIPMGALIPTIYEGEAGTKIGKMNDADGTLLGASGDVFYTVHRKLNGRNTTFSSSLVPSDLSAGIKCSVELKTSDAPKFSKLIIIRDHDFCMMRDGNNYNAKDCEKMRADRLVQESSDAIKWLLVACMIMFMTIVLLFIYIYWLRSTFISEEIYQNEHDTEASLFVSRQRSFPSVYQDPALLDVSVDKWN